MIFVHNSLPYCIGSQNGKLSGTLLIVTISETVLKKQLFSLEWYLPVDMRVRTWPCQQVYLEECQSNTPRKCNGKLFFCLATLLGASFYYSV